MAASTQDAVSRRLIEAVRAAGADRVTLDLRGGGTKGFYAGPPRGRPLELAELAGISAYEPSELVISARAGTPLALLEAALADRGQCLPFEPPRFAPAGTVGGMVAAGLAGPARAAQGSVRDHLLGATILDGRAEVLSFGGQVIKNVAGYDVARLFAGSWGILGVLLEVSLKVLAVPPARATCRLPCTHAQALQRLAQWAAKPWPLSASAWYEDQLYLRFAGAGAAVEAAVAECAGIMLEPALADRWWEEVRDHRLAFFRPDEAAIAAGEALWRVSLPANAGWRAPAGRQLFEWGGALHWWRGVAEPEELRGAARSAGGHATLVRAADKPDGAFDALGEASGVIHRRLKQSFDPFGIFNPGRLYPDL
ncbi:MAG: glycolate oxidase subunit GlcE [Steroidobacteraceae bacterium]|nr:glycolate oxidase subunit GlcE [Steroidobacteraceae bacterium]